MTRSLLERANQRRKRPLHRFARCAPQLGGRLLLDRIRKTLRDFMPLLRSAKTRGLRAWAWSERTARDPKARDRAAAASVFTVIFAFGAMSTDYLITGGPNWNPGAFDLPRTHYAEAAAATALPGEFQPPPAPAQDEAPVSFHNAALSADDLLGGPRAVLASGRFGERTLILLEARAEGPNEPALSKGKPVFISS